MDSDGQFDTFLTPLQSSQTPQLSYLHRTQQSTTSLICDQLRRLQRTTRMASRLAKVGQSECKSGSLKTGRGDVERVDRLLCTLRGRNADFRESPANRSPKDSRSKRLKVPLSPNVVHLESLFKNSPEVSPTALLKRKLTFDKLPFRWSRVTLDPAKEELPGDRRGRLIREPSLPAKGDLLSGLTAQSIRNLACVKKMHAPQRPAKKSEAC